MSTVLSRWSYALLFVALSAGTLGAQVLPFLGPDTEQETTEEPEAADTQAEDSPSENKFESQLAAYEAWANDYGALFSERLHTKRFLLKDYQWISCFVLVFLGLFVDFAIRFLLSWIVRFVRKDSDEGDTESDKQAERKVWKPIGLLAQASTWYFGSFLIGFPISVLRVLAVGLKLFAVFAAVWTAFRVIDWLAGVISRKALGTATKFDDILVPLIQKCLKAFVVCTGIVFFADVFDLEVTALIGGLGLGG